MSIVAHDCLALGAYALSSLIAWRASPLSVYEDGYSNAEYEKYKEKY